MNEQTLPDLSTIGGGVRRQRRATGLSALARKLDKDGTIGVSFQGGVDRENIVDVEELVEMIRLAVREELQAFREAIG